MFALGLPVLSSGIDPFTVLLVAFAVDALIGDPSFVYKQVPHPVVAIGALIGWLERRLNNRSDTNGRRFWLGLLTTVVTVVLVALVAWAASWLVRQMTVGWLIEAILASTLIAFRGLYNAVGAVALGLSASLEEGRSAVAHIVGRDPKTLDRHGVARAAIESTAENFADGAVAPIVWYALLGLPGLAAYKAINTLDSMIGYRDDRYQWFGKSAARLDDVANWLPARLAGVLICLAAMFAPRANGRSGWRTMWLDASKHRSPNAGWPEAAMAGALGLALAGPRVYGAETVDDPWLGDGRQDATVNDIRAARHLYLWAGSGMAAAILALAIL